MKKVFTTIGIVLAVILAALIVTPIAMRGKIDKIIKAEAGEMLNARFDYSDLYINLLRHFPNATVSLHGLSVEGIDRFEGDTIVAADNIAIVINLMSLFKDSGIEVNRILLEHPRIYGHVLSDGTPDWDIVKSDSEQDSVQNADTVSRGLNIKIRDLKIVDASMRYLDEQSGMEFSTSPVNVHLKGDLSADRTTLDLNLAAEKIFMRNGGMTVANGQNLGFKAGIDADLADRHFVLSDAKLKLNSVELGIDGSVTLGDTFTDVDVKADCHKVNFKDILSLVPAIYTREFKTLTVGGDMSLDVWAKGRMQDGTLPAFGVTLEVSDGSFKYAALPQSVTDINLQLVASNPGGALDATYIDLSRLSLTMAGNTLGATLRLRTPVSNPNFDATVKGTVNLSQINQVYPLPDTVKLSGVITADVEARGTMSQIKEGQYEQMRAKGTFSVSDFSAHVGSLPKVAITRASASITPATLSLQSFNGQMGVSDLSMNGSLSNYLGYVLNSSILVGSLNVVSNNIDLNEIMGLDNTQPKETTTEEVEQTEASDTTSGFSIPRNLDLALNTSLGKITLKKIIISSLTGRVTVKDGRAELSNLAMNAFDGRLTASGAYSTVNPSLPEAKLSLNFADASFKTTFKQLETVRQLVPIFEKTGGNYSLSMNLATTLSRSLDPQWNTLNATGELSTSDIEIQNVEALSELAKVLKNDALKKWQINDAVIVKFTIADGRIATKPFNIKVGDVAMTLSGSTGLDKTIDYTAKVTLPKNGLIGNLDVKIGGTFASPKISLDTKQAATELINNAVGQKLAELTGSESAGEALDKQAQALRKSAQTAGDKLVAEAEKQKKALVDKTSNQIAKFAAEKAGDKLIEAAKQQQQKLLEQAEAEVQKLQNK